MEDNGCSVTKCFHSELYKFYSSRVFPNMKEKLHSYMMIAKTHLHVYYVIQFS